MFGYVRIQKDDLKIRDFHTYRKKYCGLCYALGKKYGFIYRSIISYDMVFLVLVLENFKTEMSAISFRCPMNFLKKIDTDISNQIMDYCAFINYYLAELKLEDDVMDEKRLIKKIALKIFNHNVRYKSMLNIYGDKLLALSKLMANVNALEKTNADFDELSNAFGEFFVGIFKLFFDLHNNQGFKEENTLYSLCFNLGKWIYIMDAYEDYNEDIKDGKFNLLKKMIQEDDSCNKLKAHKKIAAINEILILKMKSSFNQITWCRHSEILYNIISLGCVDTYWKVLHKRYPEIESIIQMKYIKK